MTVLLALVCFLASTIQMANAQGQATWLGEGTVSDFLLNCVSFFTTCVCDWLSSTVSRQRIFSLHFYLNFFYIYIFFRWEEGQRFCCFFSAWKQLFAPSFSDHLFLSECWTVLSLWLCLFGSFSLDVFVLFVLFLLSYRTGWRLPSTDNIILGWWHALVHGLSGLFLYCPHLCSRLQRARRAS